MEKQRRRTSTLAPTSSMSLASLTRKATILPPTLLTVLPPWWASSPWKALMRADLPTLLPPTTPTRHSTDMLPTHISPDTQHTHRSVSTLFKKAAPIRAAIGSRLAAQQLLSRPLGLLRLGAHNCIEG